MVKIYKRYKEASSFGVITSGLILEKEGECITNALSDVVSWNVKQSTSRKLYQHDKLITSMAKSKSIIAIGYADGSIRLLGNEMVVLNGHRSAVTALCFNSTGTRLASGSSDTDVVLWDVISEEGLCRLKGHKDQVTCIQFIEGEGNVDHLITGAKDCIIKVWDIQARFCVENIVSHRGEIWSISIKNDMLLTGCSDGMLRVWHIDQKILSSKLSSDPNPASNESKASEISKAVSFKGSIERQSNDKILKILFHPILDYIGVLGSEKSIELFKIRNDAEMSKLLKRKQKKAIKKGISNTSEIEIFEKIIHWSTIRGGSKVKSFDFATSLSKSTLRLFLGMANNSIEIYDISIETSNELSELVNCIELQGHRSDIRTISLNEDDSLIASGSSDRLKIYSADSQICLYTISSGYALCCCFLPGSKHVVIGTKMGELQLFELSSSSMIENIKAHDGPIWSMDSLPDKSGLITGSEDKQVKFWSFSFLHDSNYSENKKRVTLIHTKTLKLSDDVLSVRVSPNGQLLAVALLDLTVKVFYVDSLKFFLSLYGHKLPVVSMDISFDSRIIITASSDKTVKIWGLDFGDCHRSLLAHQDAVMSCRFVWGTYYFFTASKDRTIKYFDGEKFEEISELSGHHGEIWSLAVGKYGNYVVTASHDKSIRIWEKTDDQFVLEEERESKLEKIYDSIDLGQDFTTHTIGSKVEDVENDEQRDELATKATGDSLKAGELLVEALTVWNQENIDLNKYLELKPRQPDLMLPARNSLTIQKGLSHLPPEECVLSVASKIRASYLNDALLTLPFSSVDILLECIAVWARRNLDPILVSKIVSFLVKYHHDEIVANQSLKECLEQIRSAQYKALQSTRDKIGYNIYGIAVLLREISNMELDFLPIEDVQKVSEIKGTKRKLKVVA